MVILITWAEDKRKLEELFDNLRIPLCYQYRGRDTPPSKMLNIFGLGETPRLITMDICPNSW